MRTIPTFPEGRCLSPRDESGLWTQKYEIEVITPMFGGGVLTKQNDPITPIRIPSVLGHLRFWWRATAGRAYNTVDELRQAESALWGTLTTPGRVFAFVNEVTPPSNTFRIEILTKTNRGWGYRFPLPKPQLVRCDVRVPTKLRTLPNSRLNEEESKGIVIETNAALPPWVKSARRFTLMLGLRTASSKDIDQVLMALRAWCNFGGIGAGTRRGFGALYCKTLARDTDSLFLEDRTNHDWTTLQSRPLLRNGLMDVTDAWHHAIQLLHEFRQGDGIGRCGRGRSYWPEADSLRALSNQGNPRHRPGNTLSTLAHMCVVHEQALPGVGFPRAGFGLPITFQFLGDDQDSNAEATLTPAQSKRLASCLILRPYKDAQGIVSSMILRLAQPTLDAANLRFTLGESWAPPFPDKWNKKGVTLEPSHIINPAFASYNNSPLQVRSELGDAVEGFLTFAGAGCYK